MTKDERIQGLLEANNRNTDKRRILSKTLRDHLKVIPEEHHDHINAVLAACGPE